MGKLRHVANAAPYVRIRGASHDPSHIADSPTYGCPRQRRSRLDFVAAGGVWKGAGAEAAGIFGRRGPF